MGSAQWYEEAFFPVVRDKRNRLLRTPSSLLTTEDRRIFQPAQSEMSFIDEVLRQFFENYSEQDNLETCDIQWLNR